MPHSPLSAVCEGTRHACMLHMPPCSPAGTCARSDGLSLCGADGRASGSRRCSTPTVGAQTPLLRGHAASQIAHNAAVAPCRSCLQPLSLARRSCLPQSPAERARARPVAPRAPQRPPPVCKPGGLAGAAAAQPAGDSARGIGLVFPTLRCAGRVEMCLPADFDSEMAGVGTCRRVQARLLPTLTLTCSVHACLFA